MTLSRRAAILTALTLGAATMVSRADDLTELFTAQPTNLAIPIRYLSGTIQFWNPITLENTVKVGTTTILTNLPVLGVAEAASLHTGVVVGIAVVDSSWAIIGRFVIPATADADDAITQIGQRAYTATVLTQETTNSSTFVDLATVGPQVTGVRIPASGKVEVVISAQFTGTSPDPVTIGAVGVAVSGDTTIAPDTKQSLLFLAPNPAGIQASRSVLFTGLPAGGSCTFKLQYQADGSTDIDFAYRDIIVRAL